MTLPAQLVRREDTAISSFDEIIDRQHDSSLKWEKYRGRDIIPLWVADMDFKAPPAVQAALHQAVERGCFGYTLPSARLTAGICEHLEREYAWRIEPRSLVWLPGVVTGLNVSCRATGFAGSTVATAVPVYPPFLSAPGLSGRELFSFELAENAGCYRLDLRASDLPESTRLLMLCNPHNPVGRVFSRSELENLAQICLKRDITLCSDEIHCGLVLDESQRHIPVASLDQEIAAKTITLMAPSKTYNLPGLGFSFAVIENRELRKRFLQVMDGIVPHVNQLGLVAAAAAYCESEDWRQELLGYLRLNRDLVADWAASSGVPMPPLQATYLAWLDFRALALEEPGAFFEAGGVGLSDGADFGAPGFARLNFGCPRARLEMVLERMSRALKNR